MRKKFGTSMIKTAAALMAMSCGAVPVVSFAAETETEAEKETEKGTVMYALTSLNVRESPSTQSSIIETLRPGDSIMLLSGATHDWRKEATVWAPVITSSGKKGFCSFQYLAATKGGEGRKMEGKEEKEKTKGYPKKYKDETLKVNVVKEWYKHAWVYAAEIKTSDFSRIFTRSSSGKYGGSLQTVKEAYDSLPGVVLMTNDDWTSYAERNATVVRNGVVEHGGKFNGQGGYNANTGMLVDGKKMEGKTVEEMVAAKELTDTFGFGPTLLRDGEYVGGGDTSRAQRTFIGQGKEPGHIWLCVSDGRMNDGESDGLTFKEEAEFLESKGCTTGFNLDGGGSSTMVTGGEVLNAIYGTSEGPRQVADFVVIK